MFEEVFEKDILFDQHATRDVVFRSVYSMHRVIIFFSDPPSHPPLGCSAEDTLQRPSSGDKEEGEGNLRREE